MPRPKQTRRPQKKTSPPGDTDIDIGHEIKQGLKAIANKAREGDPQALKLLLAYREDRKDDGNRPDFRDLTELERRRLELAITDEIIRLRGASAEGGGS